MTGTPPAPLETLGILTPRAFDATIEQQITSITPNPDVIDQIGAIAAEVHPDFALPVAARGLTVVLRDGRGLVPHRWDGHYKEAGNTQSYIPLSEIGKQAHAVSALSKAQIMAFGRPVLELSADGFTRSLGPILAGTLTGTFAHPNLLRMSITTYTDLSRSPGTNARRIAAVRRVAEEGLEPFTIIRRTSPGRPEIDK